MGRMKLMERIPGDEGAICIFRNLGGVEFAVKRPMISQEKEVEILTSVGFSPNLNLKGKHRIEKG